MDAETLTRTFTSDADREIFSSRLTLMVSNKITSKLGYEFFTNEFLSKMVKRGFCKNIFLNLFFQKKPTRPEKREDIRRVFP